jgi:hypothetical protein
MRRNPLEGNPKLRLEKMVSKSVSYDLVNGWQKDGCIVFIALQSEVGSGGRAEGIKRKSTGAELLPRRCLEILR